MKYSTNEMEDYKTPLIKVIRIIVSSPLLSVSKPGGEVDPMPDEEE